MAASDENYRSKLRELRKLDRGFTAARGYSLRGSLTRGQKATITRAYNYYSALSENYTLSPIRGTRKTANVWAAADRDIPRGLNPKILPSPHGTRYAEYRRGELRYIPIRGIAYRRIPIYPSDFSNDFRRIARELVDNGVYQIEIAEKYTEGYGNSFDSYDASNIISRLINYGTKYSNSETFITGLREYIFYDDNEYNYDEFDELIADSRANLAVVQQQQYDDRMRIKIEEVEARRAYYRAKRRRQRR